MSRFPILVCIALLATPAFAAAVNPQIVFIVKSDETRAKLIERHAALRRQRHAGKQPGQQHDGQRAHTDDVELFDDVMAIERRSDDGAQRRPGETDIFLRFERRWGPGNLIDETDIGGGLAFWAFNHTSNIKAFYVRGKPGGALRDYDQFNAQWQLAFF